MVTNRYHKRYCAATLLTRVKNPIKFAREMLIRGGHDGPSNGNCGNDSDPTGGAADAQGHSCLSGSGAEKLAKAWGLELVDPKYFWTRKRWEQHRKGLGKPTTIDGAAVSEHDEGEGWDGVEYLPQGTVGCVALDRDGTLCVATSTGGLTNKLAGRIGDTPTSGAGFWAEEWIYQPPPPSPLPKSVSESLLGEVASTVRSLLPTDCLPTTAASKRYRPIKEKESATQLRAIAVSGTGNGDSFLRLAACRTVGAIVRFSPPPPDGLEPIRTLASALNQIAGPGGELQLSAEDRWGKTGEGEGGIIGIEFVDDGKGDAKGEVVFDFNCGGMFRCWVDAHGKERVMVFREEY